MIERLNFCPLSPLSLFFQSVASLGHWEGWRCLHSPVAAVDLPTRSQDVRSHHILWILFFYRILFYLNWSESIRFENINHLPAVWHDQQEIYFNTYSGMELLSNKYSGCSPDPHQMGNSVDKILQCRLRYKQTVWPSLHFPGVVWLKSYITK